MSIPTTGDVEPAPPPAQRPTQRPNRRPNPLGVAGFVVSLVGLLWAVIPVIGAFAWFLLVPGFVLALVAVLLRHRRRGLAVTGVVLAVVGFVFAGIYVAAIGKVVSDTTSGTSSSGGSSASADAVGLNQPATDGDVQFTATAFSCGTKTIGSAPLSATAQGQFCILKITARNTGKDAATLTDSALTLFDTQGRKFDADSAASIYLPDNAVLFTTINPGNTATGQVVFDVPTDFAPDHANLRSGLSIVTNGVDVRLT